MLRLGEREREGGACVFMGELFNLIHLAQMNGSVTHVIPALSDVCIHLISVKVFRRLKNRGRGKGLRPPEPLVT